MVHQAALRILESKSASLRFACIGRCLLGSTGYCMEISGASAPCTMSKRCNLYFLFCPEIMGWSLVVKRLEQAGERRWLETMSCVVAS